MASKAQQTVTVQFQAKGEQPLINAIKALDKASKDLTRAQKKLSNTTETLNNTQKKARKSTRILGGSLAVIRSRMLLFNFALGLGVRQLGKFATTASKVENMERAFKTLSGEVDHSQDSLNKLKEATNGTMSEFDLFQQANNAMILGVSKNSDEMAEMFDIAQRLGRALGKDTASSVESLITGIGRQSRLMLDNIGIIVKADEAYASYAKKLGISVDQLTDQEKKQAFLTSAMESARTKVKEIGDEIETNQDVYDNLGRATAELSVATGKMLQPALVSTSKAFTGLFESTTKYFNSLTLADTPIQQSMTSERKLQILLARKQKLNHELILSQLFTNVQTEKTLRKKRRVTKIEGLILDLTNKISEANKKAIQVQNEKNKTEDDGNKIIDYRAQISQQELNILRQKNEAMIGGISIAEQLKLIEEERELNRLKLLQSDITKQDADKKDLELTGKKISLEEKLGQVKIDTVSSTIGALSELAKSSKATFELGKALAISQAVIDSYGAGNRVLNSDLEFPFNVVAMIGVIATGLKNVAQIKSQKFEQGGLVGGRRHSQGGTMIEAEQGEFVMSRNAVDSIGINNLEQMNQGNSSGVTINVQGNFIGEENYVRDNIIPAIQKAQSLNLA
ncbi:MAG: hypothetical protein CMQ53_02090 [Gammaproteobacteria bacterium]|nr:hypothetical protein [Gammaproteobacteria bacterium]|tara:strand:- start:1650 stop:3524 length:1875 start_codon:yes stop_codon:yes gene_type:complete